MNECWGCWSWCLLGRCWWPFGRRIRLIGWRWSGRSRSFSFRLGLLCLRLIPSRGIGGMCPHRGLCRLLFVLLVICAGMLCPNRIRLFGSTFLGRLVRFYDFLRNILTIRFFYVWSFLMLKKLNFNESYSKCAFLIFV